MTTRRRLAITLQPDWRTALRRAGKRAQADRYQGETQKLGNRVTGFPCNRVPY
jgi:hypothetical protein